jgi:hypothetical protein
MSKLLKLAAKKGCTIERNGSGHWNVTTPSGAVIVAAFSPSTSGGVRAVRQHLRRAGVDI